MIDPRDRLIVALDLSTVQAADAMVARLGDAVSFYKIGYQLASRAGSLRPGARAPASRCFSISSCTTSATRSPRGRERGAARRHVPDGACLPADHEGGGDARASSTCGSLAVTVLTSTTTPTSRRPATISRWPSSSPSARAGARHGHRRPGLLGRGGRRLRKIVGHKMTLVTPGIRPAGAGAATRSAS